ncbi:oligosaccharide flippase family protein [Burkholderia sp. BCC1644]|uniref:lipopolysaccharide biosynthesis protein n=1 Tax=Burkholderia sp. BCC1644 TaxID=2676293 RepID=UPI0015925FFA|nr:oligosaccharide flippase family protein [Burkholderia sp. BCC1644]
MTSPTPARAGARDPSLGHDMLFVVFSKVLYLAVRLAIPPLVLAHVGLAEYGLWTTCFILVSYIGMSASGFAVVYVRFVAQYHAQGDVRAISRLLSTGIVTMGTAAIVLLAALWLGMPHLLALFKVAPASRPTAAWLWFGACAIFLLDASVGAFSYVLHGLQRIRREQQIWIAAYVLETACIALFLHAGMGVYGLLVAFGVRYVFSIAAAAIVVRVALPGLRIGVGQFDRRCLRIFFGFGTGVQIGGLISTFLQSADRMIAGLTMGPAAAAIMDLAGKLPATGASLASSVSMVALPAAARQGALGADASLLGVYERSVRMTAWLSAMVLPPLACLSPLVVAAWLGPRADAPALATILTCVALYTHLHVLTGPASSVYRGLGKLSNEYVYHALRLTGLALGPVALSVTVAISPVQLARALAVSGMSAASLYLIVSHRRLAGDIRGMVRLYVLPYGLPYAAAAAVGALAQQWPLPAHASRFAALVHLAPAGLLYTVAACAIAWRWMLCAEQRSACVARLSPLVRRAGRSQRGATHPLSEPSHD